MAKGYWVARMDVSDPEQYKRYAQSNGPVFARFGARFLVRAGAYENPEGTSRSRNVVIEFPSYQSALECYRSPEYQDLVKMRAPAATGDLLIIEGYDGPQPG